MSIQAGLWKYDGEPVEAAGLDRLARDLEVYGPDGKTVYCTQGIGMLSMPFHTTLQSIRERQPYVSRSGLVMTWDGRLDNATELISQLGMEQAAEASDIEVVATAFERWGTDCFAKLVGEWAAAVWIPQSQELVLARDYIGIRRLFYLSKKNEIAWCSHLEPLALASPELKLNEEYFAGYLSLWPEAHLTPFQQLFSVPPGKFLRAHKQKISVHAYWNFDPGSEIRCKDDREYEEQFRALFRQAVRRRLRSHTPILAELSGGLDSSSIVCMADDIVQKEGADVPCIDTLSSCDRNEPEEEDFRYFSLIEAKRGRAGKHIEVQQLDDSSTRGYFEFAHFVATPGFHGHPRLVAARRELIRENGYRVILSGVGGDEMSGQALDPRVQLADLMWTGHFGTFLSQLMEWSLLLRRPALHLLLEAAALQLPAFIRSRLTPSRTVDSWVNSGFAQRQHLSNWNAGTRDGSWSWRPSMRDWFQTLTMLSRQMTKLPSYPWEKRYPCLDQSLVEFLIAIPVDQLLRPGERRSLMRRAFAGLLPEEIRMRHTKATSARFYSRALEEHWTILEPVLRSPLLARLGYINQKHFRAALVDAKHGNLGPYFLRLMKALSWELWLRDLWARGVLAGGSMSSTPMPLVRTTLEPSQLGD